MLFYLSAKADEDLLTETRRLSGVGSFMAADAFGSGLPTLPSMQSHLATRGERGLSPPFTTDDPAATLSAAGWPSVEVVLPGQLGRTYGRPIKPVSHRPAAHDPTMQSYLVVARTAG